MRPPGSAASASTGSKGCSFVLRGKPQLMSGASQEASSLRFSSDSTLLSEVAAKILLPWKANATQLPPCQFLLNVCQPSGGSSSPSKAHDRQPLPGSSTVGAARPAHRKH